MTQIKMFGAIPRLRRYARSLVFDTAQANVPDPVAPTP